LRTIKPIKTVRSMMVSRPFTVHIRNKKKGSLSYQQSHGTSDTGPLFIKARCSTCVPGGLEPMYITLLVSEPPPSLSTNHFEWFLQMGKHHQINRVQKKG
jgi:hypothetical protein